MRRSGRFTGGVTFISLVCANCNETLEFEEVDDYTDEGIRSVCLAVLPHECKEEEEESF